MLCPSFSTLSSLGLFISFSSDSRTASPEDRFIQMLKSAIEQARSRGISTIGCTLPPQKISAGRDNDFRDEKGQTRKIDSVRVAVNEWMRTSGAFDGLADFDAITRDPANPGDLKEEFRNPMYPSTSLFSSRGHQVLADGIDLSLFARQ
jgi:hypothetical protein